MNLEDTGKFHYQMHFGIHNDEQRGFSVVKETRICSRDKGLANKMGRRAELSFFLSRNHYISVNLKHSDQRGI